MTCKYIERCYPSTLAILFSGDSAQEFLTEVPTHVFLICETDGIIEKTLCHKYYCGFYTEFERKKNVEKHS